MKLQAGQVRFRITNPWFGRRRFVFVGKKNTIQLLETALVIEGYLQRFFFFAIIDSFFRMTFSEWTTVTVPYSRVLSFRYARMLLPRVAVAALAWSPVVLMPLAAALSGDPNANWGGVLVGCACFAGFATVATLLSEYLFFVPRHYLLFRQADGRPALVAFRILSNKRRQQFEAQLNEYRQQTREQGVSMQKPQETKDLAPAPTGWGVLVVFLLGHLFAAPLFLRLTDPNAPPGALAWTWFVLPLVVQFLAVALTSLLVARRSEPARWAAVLTLGVAAMLPLMRWALTPDAAYAARPNKELDDLLAAAAALLFNGVLAVILLSVTRHKGDRP